MISNIMREKKMPQESVPMPTPMPMPTPAPMPFFPMPLPEQDMQMPETEEPEKCPEMQMPETQMPEMQMPYMQMPYMQMPCTPSPDCIPQELCVCKMRLATAYVPFQKMCRVFTPEEGLLHGTIFPELASPYGKDDSRRCGRCNQRCKEGC